MPRFLKTILFIIIAAGVAIGSVLTIRAVNNRGAAPVGWWKMDEGQGQTTYDASGNGNNGTLGASTSDTTPDPTWKNEESCKNGKCLQFDGSNDYVSATDADSLEMGSNDFSISAWVKINAGGITNEKISTILAKRAQNQVTYSEEFNNAVWTNFCSAGTMTTDTTDFAAPDGTYTAEKIVTASGCGNYVSGRIQTLSTSASTQYTVSIWAKGAAGGEIFVVSIQDLPNRCYYNLTTGWKRYTCTLTSPESPNRGFEFYVIGLTSNTYYVWGAQREMTDSSGIYTKTTSSAIDTNGYSLFMDNTTLKAAISSSTLGLTATYGSLTTGEWHFVVAVYDRSGNLGIYVDGISKGSTSISSMDGVSITNTRNLLIGGTASEGINDLNGSIDDVRIYNYARTASQIKADYNKSAGGKGASVKVASLQEQQNASDGLVGYWKMDEASWAGAAGEVVDSSGAGNNGTAVGGASTTTAAKFSRAGNFDGSNDYVNAGSGASLDITGALTIETWVHPTAADLTYYRPIAAKYYTVEERAYQLNVDEGYSTYLGQGTFQFWISSDGTERDHVEALASSNQWQHIVGVYDGSKLFFYVNGELKDSKDTSIRSITTNTVSFRIGTNENAERYFLGQIDDVKIYNKARSAEQIRMDYETGPPPVAHWKMDENSGQYAYDTSGTNNGTLGTDATANASDPQWTSGKYGNALKFDGTDDYMSKATPVNLGGTGPITVSAWIKPADLGDGGIIGKYDNHLSNYSYAFWYQSNLLYFRIGSDIAGFATQVTSTAVVSANVWYYIVGVYDKSNVKLYVDGKEMASVSENRDIGITDYYPLCIGSMRYDCVSYSGWHLTNDYFNGTIDDVRIYNYARTPKQIMEDMNAGHPASAEASAGNAGSGRPGSYAGYWNFDEGNGDTAYDKSVNANNGDLAGACPGAATCPTWTTAGKFGKALSFDGGDYVSIPDSSSLRPSNFSVSFWAKPDTISDWYRWMGKDHASYTGFILLRSATNSVYMAAYDAGGTERGSPQISYTVGEWVFCSFTFDGTYIRAYKNGIEVTPATDVGAWVFAPSTGSFYVGRAFQATYYKGLFDEVKFYPFALSPLEIKEEFNRGSSLKLGASSTASDGATPSDSQDRSYCVPGDASACAAPVAHWKMDEAQAQYAYDTSGNANTGTLGTGNTPDGSDPVWKYGDYCKTGSCLSFDGADDYVIVDPVLDQISSNQSGSFSAWVKTTASGLVLDPLLCISRSTTDAESFVISPTDTRFASGASGKDNWISYSGFNDGNWHFFTITSDGSLWRVYKDGKQIDVTIHFNSNIGDWFGDLSSLTLATFGARRRLTTGLYFSGLMDDVRIYNYARTPAQIAWDYNRGAPVGWWKMNDGQDTATTCNGTGTIVKDSSGNGNTGTLSLTPAGNTDPATAWVEGKYSCGIDFDGTDDYVDAGNTGTHLSNITVSAWIKPNAVGNGATWSSDGIVNKYASAIYYGWKLGLDSSGYATWVYVSAVGGACLTDVLTDSKSLVGSWHHVVGVRSSAGLLLYVDGLQVGSRSVACATESNNEIINIGGPRVGGASGEYFNGQIDDVRVYNYTLTPAQVKTLFNEGAAVRFGPTEGLP